MIDCQKTFELYCLANRLKDVVRTGWKRWAVERERVESIAEHVYGSIMLAVAIISNSDIKNLDVQKVVTMLALHETEEILIGDLTYMDKEYKNKRQMGEEAVAKIFAGCDNSESFLKLIAEYNQNQTNEAKFAHMCDHMEGILQAYLYKDNFNYKKMDASLLKDEFVKTQWKNGERRAEKLFLKHDKHEFTAEFKQLIDWLESKE